MSAPELPVAAWLDDRGALVRLKTTPNGGCVAVGRAIPDSWKTLTDATAAEAKLAEVRKERDEAIEFAIQLPIEVAKTSFCNRPICTNAAQGIKNAFSLHAAEVHIKLLQAELVAARATIEAMRAELDEARGKALIEAEQAILDADEENCSFHARLVLALANKENSNGG